MKRYIFAAATAVLTMGLTSCSDWLEQEPVSQLSPEGFYNDAAKAQAAANQLYDNILPSHGGWDFGQYGAGDLETDNQVDKNPDNKYGTGLWLVASTSSNWSWTNIRNVNYQLQQVVNAYEAGEMAGSESEIRQYIGEMYFLRAYAYFDMLKKFGDLPIITEPLVDDEAMLIEASKREPCNMVARFILEDLDKAISHMTDGFSASHQRISPDVARLFKSRVALYEGSWLRNFAGTPFVPGDANWPGASKANNAGFSYQAGSLEQEAQYFFTVARDEAETVAEKFKNNLVVNNGIVPQQESDSNPYFQMWGTKDMSGTPEILLWRQYSRSLGINCNVEVMVNKGNYGIGLTRGYVESFLMADGKPIYNSSYTYSDQTIADVRANRDPRLFIFLKEPGQLNYYKNVNESAGDHAVEVEPYPDITRSNAEDGYSTGYCIRKGGMFDRDQARNGGGENAYAIFRATEALLNYMEAAYELSGNVNSGKILEYWTIVRKCAGFTGEGLDPTSTIAATDMSKETGDWGAYTAGKLVDATLYNIRRERRCELIGEGFRGMDLQRWRSYDQLIATPAHIEGMHLYNTPMQGWYDNLVGDGTSNSNVSQASVSEYLRPHEINMANNRFPNGLTWHMAHYLEPLPVRQFILTASDYTSPELSELYQNPYWTTTAGDAAQQ